MKIDFSFKREERLKSFRVIRELFASGRILNHYPFRIIWLPLEENLDFPVQIAITVPRKKFSRAVQRNRIKRLIREAYRHNKHKLYQMLEGSSKAYAVMIIYVDKEMPAYETTEARMVKALERLGKKMLREAEDRANDKIA